MLCLGQCLGKRSCRTGSTLTAKENAMKIFTTLALIPTLVLVTGCTRTVPTITEFTATPQSFCVIPNKVLVKWNVIGSASRTITADTTVEGIPVDPDPAGSTEVIVNTAPTTFTLTAVNTEGTTTELESVGQLTGTREYALGGAAECVDGRLVRTVSVLEDEYSREVVVRSLSVPAGALGTEVFVQGPGGSVSVPALGSVPFGGPLVGNWTISLTPTPRCTPVMGTDALLSLKAEVGCP